jgi:hypothetical protein
MKSNSPSYYTFRNRDEQTFQLRGDLTMEDLVRMGYGDIRLVHPETPLKPHEWRCDPPPNPISYTVSTSSRRFRCKMCGEKCRSSNQDRGKRDMCRPCEQRYKYDK